jgi:hypothetical protein
LWVELAKPLSLDSTLRQAELDDLGLYTAKSLRVTVRPQIHRAPDRPQGSYTYGHVTLYPCPSCSFAFLTLMYLHELFHAWLDDLDPELYLDWDHCDTADSFADTAFDLLGGVATERCRAYKLPKRIAWMQIPVYRAFADTMAKQGRTSIRQWNASKEAERLTGR